jgi:hypothetical protein
MPIIVYAIAVFVLCFISIRFLHRMISTLLIVVLWTLLGPMLMEVANVLHVWYLDPFCQWTATIEAVIALVASVAALMVNAAIEKGPEVK